MRDFQDTNVQRLKLLPNKTPKQDFKCSRIPREDVEIHTLPTSSKHSALTVALKPLVVDGTTINISKFSWDVRKPGHEARHHARKERAS